MLCEVCHARPAANHTTTIIDGVMQTRDLCQECFEATAASPERELAAQLRAARCYFCGGGINAGGTDPLAQPFGVQRTRYFCFRCLPIYSDCVERALSEMPRNLPPEQRSALLETLTQKVDREVRQKLAEQK